jgi:hypothetical protein
MRVEKFFPREESPESGKRIENRSPKEKTNVGAQSLLNFSTPPQG